MYDEKHSFVYKRAEGVLELLAPRNGERVLDLGCGTAHLTARIRDAGADVIGLDASPAMIAKAKAEFPGMDLRVADGRDFRVEAPVDAVFSNAALHWMQPPGAVVACVARALKPGGRFVAEMGGHGNLATQLEGLRAAVFAAGHEAPRLSEHLFFPTISEYGAILEANGLELRHAMLFDRPTPLDGGEAGLRNWVRQFGMHVFEVVPEAQREAVLRDCEARLRAKLWDGKQWVADYRRLRFVAAKR
jgi:trans-aconitate methyltransferase